MFLLYSHSVKFYKMFIILHVDTCVLPFIFQNVLSFIQKWDDTL